MFSATVNESNNAPFWKTMVTCLRTSCSPRSSMAVMSCPSTQTLPLSGFKNPSKMRRDTDLPTPLRPRMHKVCPRPR